VPAGEFPRALRLLARGLRHPRLLITAELPLREVAAAFAIVDRDLADTLEVVLDVQAG
jgi:threonine dehydrogenase-like Zn-dependent dehydrogenase